ncbi:MAG TPA: hypothetical protein VGH09_01620 [Solirubrobacteraceae bacterium]|jgi:hypothetical protein
MELNLQISQHFLDDRGQRAGFVVLGALLLSFLFIRTSARMIRSPKFAWWPGSVETKDGLHLHHLVWGICLMMASGFLDFALAPLSPWSEVLAGAFGVGAGLTLDEFALWVHLEDVYWSQEGRSSLDAVLVATMLGGLVVLGLAPFDLANQEGSISSLVVAILIDIGLAALAILKGKPLLGLLGVFVPFFSLVAAVRLASPTSPWARRRYGADSSKMVRCRERFARVRRLRTWLSDAIGGTPSAQ